MSLGFIGLGNIGKPMALQLLKLGELLQVYDVAAAPLQELRAAGAEPVAHPGQLGDCRIVGLCVRDDHDVETLLYGERGLLAVMRPDSIIAVHSTVTQAALLRWVQDAAARGVHLVDAPISGGAAGAAAGTLVYMVGGDVTVFERCKPVFAASGQHLIHAGATGAGIALKLCNNLMTYAAFAAMSEAAALARACGLDPQRLVEVGRGNGVVTPQMASFLNNREALAEKGRESLEKGFAPFAALARKDLQAALASAQALNLPLPMTEQLTARIEDVFLRRLAPVSPSAPGDT